MVVVLCVWGLLPQGPAAWADPHEGDIGAELDQAVEDYIAAQEILNNSLEEQESIKDEIAASEDRVEELRAEVNDFAESAYMAGGLQPTFAVMATHTPEAAMEALSISGYLGEESGRALNELLQAQEDLAARQEALDDEIVAAEDAEAAMRDARDAAAQEFAASGGDWSMGPEPGDFPKAEPAPRNPDGSLPAETCSMEDPVTPGGCLTPRTVHAMNEAIAAGFTREISSCYRSLQDGGDHPSGRACDYTVGSQGGFAEGEARVYGDNCAAWFVENAEALGVKGIIWYNQLWTPATDWGPYYNGYTGDPSLDHANHVHVSML